MKDNQDTFPVACHCLCLGWRPYQSGVYEFTHWDIVYAACSFGEVKNARILTVSGIVFGTQWFKDIVKHVHLVEISNCL